MFLFCYSSINLHLQTSGFYSFGALTFPETHVFQNTSNSDWSECFDSAIKNLCTFRGHTCWRQVKLKKVCISEI